MQQPRVLSWKPLDPNLPLSNYVILIKPPLDFDLICQMRIIIVQKRGKIIILSICTRGILIGYVDEGGAERPGEVTEQSKYLQKQGESTNLPLEGLCVGVNATKVQGWGNYSAARGQEKTLLLPNAQAEGQMLWVLHPLLL